MGRKLEWELSGKSDVPQKMAQAKASMEGLEGASNALSKKFKEAFKDIAVGFLSPVLLIHQAIGFITSQFERLKQFAADSREFAKDADSGKYFRAGGREALLQQEARKKEEEARLKGRLGTQLGYADFLLNDPRGLELMKKFSLPSASIIQPGKGVNPATDAVLSFAMDQLQQAASAQGLAARQDIRAQIDAMLSGDIAKRAAAEAASKANEAAPSAQKINELSSNVIGVGMSPQLDIATKQLNVQEDMANSLRLLIERDQAESGFTPNKFYPTSRRLNLPR